jgi:hypothetical protein
MICVIRARLTCDIAAVCHTPGRTEEFERYQLRGATAFSYQQSPPCGRGTSATGIGSSAPASRPTWGDREQSPIQEAVSR